MIGYSDKQNNSEDYENYSLSLSILRTDYDRILDHTIKKTILCGKLRQLTEMFGDDFVYDTAITSVQETIGTLSELRGVFIEGVTVLPDHYLVQRLSEENLAEMSLKKRALLLEKALTVISQIEDEGIYPGPISLDSIIYDASDHSDEIFIGNVEYFQLGALRHTWPLYNRDEHAGAEGRFFDQRLQAIADVRLFAKLIIACVDDLYHIDEKAELLGFSDEIISVLRAPEPEPIKKLIGLAQRIAMDPSIAMKTDNDPGMDTLSVTIVIPPCSCTQELILWNRQIAMINDLIWDVCDNETESNISIAYIWSGSVPGSVPDRSNSTVNITDYVPISQSDMPNIQCDCDGSRSSDFTLSCIAADSLIRSRIRSEHLLFILFPLTPETAKINCVMDGLCQSDLSGTDRANIHPFYLYAEPHKNGGIVRMEKGFNTDSPEDLKRIEEKLTSVIRKNHDVRQLKKIRKEGKQ